MTTGALLFSVTNSLSDWIALWMHCAQIHAVAVLLLSRFQGSHLSPAGLDEVLTRVLVMSPDSIEALQQSLMLLEKQVRGPGAEGGSGWGRVENGERRGLGGGGKTEEGGGGSEEGTAAGEGGEKGGSRTEWEGGGMGRVQEARRELEERREREWRGEILWQSGCGGVEDGGHWGLGRGNECKGKGGGEGGGGGGGPCSRALKARKEGQSRPSGTKKVDRGGTRGEGGRRGAAGGGSLQGGLLRGREGAER